jgi:hypothetical protein
MISKSGKLPSGYRREVELGVIRFVWNNLAAWRKSLPDTPPPQTFAEEALNEDLCGFLDNASRSEEWFFFQHEVRQKGRRRVDFAAKPDSDHLVARGYYPSIREKIVVFEAKRLPAPDTRREREYVTGGIEVSGGIQRFKTGDHGGEHTIAVLIGYIQAYDISYFHKAINSWITEYSLTSPDGLPWSTDECLGVPDVHPDHTACLQSKHPRINNTPIELHHLWMVIQI